MRERRKVMKLFVRDPFREFDRLFCDCAGGDDLAVDRPKEFGGCFMPRADIIEHEEMAQIVMEIPGVKQEDVSVNVEGSVLTIEGERKPKYEKGYRRTESCYGKFERRFSLPDTIDTEKVSADYNLGLLMISLPKKPKAVPKKIGVSIS